MPAAPKKLKFYSPDGTPIRVTLPDGSVALVGETPRELHPKFNRAAVREGCLTTDMPSADRIRGPAVPDADDAFKRRDLIKDKIHEALNAPEGAEGYEDAFTQAGVPNINWLNKALGFNIERSERDELWVQVQAEAEAEDGDGENDGGNTEDVE